MRRTILAREAPVGNVAIVPSNELVCLGQRTVLIRADESKVHPHYLLRVMLSDYCQNRFSGASSGATVAHLNLRDLRGLEIPFAPKEVQDATAPTFENLDRQIANLFKRNRILKATRDLLLPKLISGKLNVEDLDIDVGEPIESLEEATA
jgi:type I restriction enzyme S subunit